MPVLKHRPPSPEAPAPVFGTGREKIPSPTVDPENPSDNKALPFTKSIFLRPPSGSSLFGEAFSGSNTVNPAVSSFVAAANTGDNLTTDEKKEARARKFLLQSKQPSILPQTLSPSRPVKRPASTDSTQESAKV